jgi:hypothetical protein
MMGKVMLTKTQSLSQGNTTVSLPILQLAAGTYYLVVDNKEKRQTKSFIKQ